MHRIVAALTAAAVTTGACAPAFALDFASQSWQPAQGAAAVAYLRIPFGGASNARPTYGLALTAPTPRIYGAAPRPIFDRPMLIDLRFSGVQPDSVRVSGRIAWTQNPSDNPEGARQNFLGGGLIGTALSLASLGLGAWGIYKLVHKKKDCPTGQMPNSAGACAP